eukprot:m.19854 g.19854  ORF g.19854 m.19854 type:complete len:725 (+) comp5178_c0_seq2:35-2209(+)
MDVNLTATNYLQVASTSTKTLQLVPSSSGKLAKVVVGDLDGVLTCFGVKKQAAVIVFKTIGGPPIERTEMIKDRVFVATGAEVHGYSKKGKNFFTISTYLTEPIKNMCVKDSHIQVAGDYIYTHYIDNKDTYSYMSQAIIRDMITLFVPKRATNSGSKPNRVHEMAVLACADSMLRLLQGGEVMHLVDVESPPNVIVTLDDPASNSVGLAVVGMENGNFSLIQFARDECNTIWTKTHASQQPSITSLCTFDITGSGSPDVIVGRRNGAVEVYTFDDDGDVFLYEPPTLVYQTNMGSSITSMVSGFVSYKEHPEIVVATYAGHVVGLHTNPQLQSKSSTDASLSQNNATMEQLKDEIAALEEELRSLPLELEKLQQDTLPDLRYSCKYDFLESQSCNLLSIESEVSLDYIMIQSTIPLDLLDVEASTAVACFSQQPQESGNKVVATYTCGDGVTNFNVRIRSIEGQYGEINIFIVPQTHGNETAVAHKHQLAIHALAMHRPTREPVDLGSLSNTLTITGDVSISKMHVWLGMVLPDLPTKFREVEKWSIMYKSTLVGTYLQCELTKGKLVVKSDNLSSLTIVKDCIANAATKENTPVDIEEEMDAESCILVLHRIIPVLEHCVGLSRKVDIIQTLKEIEAQEGSTSALSKEHADIIANADTLMQEYLSQPFQIERLYGIITDLFMDRCKAVGINGKPYLNALMGILDEHNFNELIPFFLQEDLQA